MNDVIHSFRLQETTFDKKSYITYIKGYMKKIKQHLLEKNPDRVAKFEAAAGAFVKKVLENFSEYQFFQGESMDPDAMVVLVAYEGEAAAPYALFFMDGLRIVKMVTK